MVYLIENVEAGLYKIGYSAKPAQRLSNLQTATVDTLRLIGWVEGSMEDEKRLHSEFAHHHVKGEWFYSHDEIAAAFHSIEREQADVQLYMNSPTLHSLTSMKDMRVLLALAELAEFNTNAVFLIASRRQQVMARANVSTAQLSVALRRLREAGILSGLKGEAIIHPAVLWKGNSAVRREKLAELAKQVKSTFENE